MNESYIQGFVDKCAERNVDPVALLKSAGPNVPYNQNPIVNAGAGLANVGAGIAKAMKPITPGIVSGMARGIGAAGTNTFNGKLIASK